jgi:hypothetical protein
MEPQGVHESRPPVRILSQIYHIDSLEHYFPNIHFNIILLSAPRSSEWSLSFRLSNHNILRIFHCPIPRPYHHWFVHPNI